MSLAISNHMVDAYDDLMFGRTSEEGGYRSYSRDPYWKTCKYCNTHDLRWGLVDGKWKLFSEKGPHTCKSI